MSSFTDPSQSGARSGGLGIRDYVLLTLVLLAIGGIAIMDLRPDWGFTYWIAMVPVFGVLSIFIEWRTQMRATDPRPVHLRAQILHWLVTGLGIALVFFVEEQTLGFERPETALIALLLLGISTVLIGIHAEWRLVLVGALLLITLAAAVAADHFFWLMLIPAVIAIWVIVQRRRPKAGG